MRRLEDWTRRLRATASLAVVRLGDLNRRIEADRDRVRGRPYHGGVGHHRDRASAQVRGRAGFLISASVRVHRGDQSFRLDTGIRADCSVNKRNAGRAYSANLHEKLLNDLAKCRQPAALPPFSPRMWRGTRG
jgi:hypothetical protein